MTRLMEVEIFLPPWVVLPVFFGLLILSGKLIDLFSQRYLRRWAAHTAFKTDDLFLQSLIWSIHLWLVLIGLYVTVNAFELPARLVHFASQATFIGFVLTLIYLGSRFLILLIREYGSQYEPIRASTGLLENLTRAVVLLSGLMVILDSLDVSIAPLLTTLGIGSLAVALALQDTLANFFAGLYLLADRPIQVGDYIRLDTGDEGYVERIGWRSARIRTLLNNIVIIPNQKLSQSTITNYCLPDSCISLRMKIGVSYDSDPQLVERFLVDVAQEAVGSVEGLLGEPAPFARFIPGFSDFSLDFTLACQVRQFADQYHVQHELHKRIFERFKQEGIEIPFPIRTVYLKGITPASVTGQDGVKAVGSLDGSPDGQGERLIGERRPDG
ncbi:MAG: mechanosensitive ion channel family protein [Candidatus Tectomicrobia bacterium]|uniref:Mechanosensitive ion channel family protein n=1 Tax=Tectimicrobiota bacterium TaxID=2528274 RepID=A0A932CPC8_UNCTE|nr:mechanosensitive ion channel family protein [Candidatus Tectomicrobia bacterium]